MKITPCIWSAGQAAEMSALYRAAFRDVVETDRQHYPTEGLLDFQEPLAGQILTVTLEIHGQPVSIINAGPEFRPNPAAGFMVRFDTTALENAQEYLDEVYSQMAEGGRVLMERGQYPFSECYAWVEDRFGVSWQLMLATPSETTDSSPSSGAFAEGRPVVVPALMFCGPAQNRCAEAMARYAAVFPGSAEGPAFHYPQPTGPATTEALMYSETRLGKTWTTAMDSGVEQDFTFTAGFSLMVAARDQEELDAWWSVLSAVPEAEQCGWCQDEFGLSWQIVPENLGELMSRPGAYQKLMSMKKIEIAEF